MCRFSLPGCIAEGPACSCHHRCLHYLISAACGSCYQRPWSVARAVECQKKDWLQHKVMCKDYCAKGQKGNGPAAPTQGEEILTPYALPLY
jgi:hypothetical protein